MQVSCSSGEEVSSTAKPGCEPQGELNFFCGTVASEDLVAVPDTNYLIVSGLGFGVKGNLYLVDRGSGAIQSLPWTDSTNRQLLGSGCEASPGESDSSFAGIDLRVLDNGQLELLVVNSRRHAIEFFDVDLQSERLFWRGCAKMPEGTHPNGVAALPQGDLLVTSFYNPSDTEAWQKMARGEPSGAVYRWRAPLRGGDGGFEVLPQLQSISGPNGIAVNEAGDTIYVSAWAESRLLVASVEQGDEVRSVPLDFLPDNIKRQTDGRLLIAGQKTTVERIAKCARQCPQAWVVARVDPTTDSSQVVLQGQGNEAVNYVAGATIVDGRVYASLRGDNRILWYQLPHY